MQKSYLLPIRLILFLGVILFTTEISRAQSVYLPNSYQLYQKFNADIYSVKSSFHTSLRPFLIDSTISDRYNAIMQRGVDSNRKSWVARKLFNEHLFDVKTKDYTFYADLLTENIIGHDFDDKSNLTSNFKPFGFVINSKLGVNTRGFQLGGTIGSKFSFYTSGFENQARFPAYYSNYVNKIGFVPGQAYDRGFGKPTKDWSYVTAIISYTPIKQLNITLGEDKTFIGDGYRSLLLSDYSANYPLLRLTANFGKVQYMAMWAYLEDIQAPKFDAFGSNRRKWAAFHYVDWNITNRLSLGFFNALIAAETDDLGNRHGFDFNYINPLFFSASLGPSSAIKDNVLAGFTGKYKVFDKTALYGQLLIDRFKASNFFSSNTDNTNGVQLGVRGADIFNVKNLNYLFEYNTVKPYTYSSEQLITNYTFYGQPLGNPLGANFKELIGILNYSIGRLDFQGQLNYAKYGLDAAGTNNGKDVTKTYIPSAVTGADTGQGISTQLYYAEGTASYLINPKYNLRLEVGGLYRNETNSLGKSKTALITFGLRSTFRNLYHDF